MTGRWTTARYGSACAHPGCCERLERGFRAWRVGRRDYCRVHGRRLEMAQATEHEHVADAMAHAGATAARGSDDN